MWVVNGKVFKIPIRWQHRKSEGRRAGAQRRRAQARIGLARATARVNHLPHRSGVTKKASGFDALHALDLVHQHQVGDFPLAGAGNWQACFYRSVVQ